MVWILHKRTPMNKKKVFLSIVMLLVLLAILYMCFGRHERPGKTTVSVETDNSLSPSETLHRPSETLRPKVVPDEPEKVPVKAAQRPPSTRFSETAAEMPSTQPEKAPPPVVLEALPAQPAQAESAMTPSSVSLEALPTQPVQAGSAMKRSVPKAPAVVLPPEEMPMARLCEGEPLSQCVDVDFTQCDFALLLLNVLALGRTENCEEAFEILESLPIGPVGGWAKANPQKQMTLREMEEVRCSIFPAFEGGLVGVGPWIVTAALNRFCEELKVSLKAIEDSGIVKGRADISAETGYQGGTNGVASSPF